MQSVGGCDSGRDNGRIPSHGANLRRNHEIGSSRDIPAQHHRLPRRSRRFETLVSAAGLRTCDPCLKRSCRTKNQRLRLTTTICYELLRMPCPARLSGDSATIRSLRQSLVVGTKLGTAAQGLRRKFQDPNVTTHKSRHKIPRGRRGPCERDGVGVLASCPAARALGGWRRLSPVRSLCNLLVFPAL
jgi:hypothetical protein